MLGFLIVALFALAAVFAAAVLADSGLRGARVYRELSMRHNYAKRYNSVTFKVGQLEQSLAQPSFRMRPVNGPPKGPSSGPINSAIGFRQATRVLALRLPVAA